MHKKFFDFSNFKGDLLGGITAGVVALPLAMAFGLASGLGASAGIYGAIFISFFASLFGGTNTQISGPTAPMTAVTIVVVTGIVSMNNGNLSLSIPAILTVFFLAGIFQIVFGTMGVGTYIKYIPRPVISGFMTAIGIIIIITQINPSIGYYPKNDKEYINQFKPMAEELLLEKVIRQEAKEGKLVFDSLIVEETYRRTRNFTEEDITKESKILAKHESNGVIGSIKLLPRALLNINWVELVLVILTILITFLSRRFIKAIPGTLLALLLVSITAYLLNINYVQIEEIPYGLPKVNMKIFTGFNFEVISMFFLSALTLSLLGAIDSLLTSVVADNMTNTKHEPNKELVGQGIGNSIAAIFGGIPGAGATIRTVVNIKAGGKTKLSGMIAGLLLLVILLLFSDVASKIPAAVLAGVLITVGFDVIDYKGLKAIPNMPRTEIFIMLLVLVLAVFWNLLFAVGIGLILATFFFMKIMGDIGKDKTDFGDMSTFKNELNLDNRNSIPVNVLKQIYIEKIYGPLFFGFENEIFDKLKDVPDIKTIVIRFENVPYIDHTGLGELDKVLIELEKMNIEILFVGLTGQPKAILFKSGIIPEKIKKYMIFDDFQICCSYMKRTLTDSKGEIK